MALGNDRFEQRTHALATLPPDQLNDFKRRDQEGGKEASRLTTQVLSRLPLPINHSDFSFAFLFLDRGPLVMDSRRVVISTTS